MIEQVLSCAVKPNGQLFVGDAVALTDHLEAGNLCLLPSDSAYVLAGSPVVPNVTADIDLVLERAGLEVPLAFGSFRMARRWAEFSRAAERFFGAVAPGAITFVTNATSNARAGLSRSRLHASGTIGVRLTESIVETQLSTELDGPLTTTPVRSNGHVIVDAEGALAVVGPRLQADFKRRQLAVVRGDVLRPGRVSTVVEEVEVQGLLELHVRRLGALGLEDVERIAATCLYNRVVQD